MDEKQFLGYLIFALITLGSFVAVIIKFIQPINDLRVVIQKLNDNIDAINKSTDQQNIKLEKHDTQIDKLDHRVGKIETKIEMYHEK